MRLSQKKRRNIKSTTVGTNKAMKMKSKRTIPRKRRQKLAKNPDKNLMIDTNRRRKRRKNDESDCLILPSNLFEFIIAYFNYGSIVHLVRRDGRVHWSGRVQP